MIAYFVNYGFYFRKSAVQWRFPLLFQLIFAAYIVIVTPFLPDTPRWLMRHETSHERGLEVLGRLRNRPINDIAVQKEADGILEAIKLEAGQEGSWADLFRGNGIAADKRFYLALGIQFMQQMSGELNIKRLASFNANLDRYQYRGMYCKQLQGFLKPWASFTDGLPSFYHDSFVLRSPLMISRRITHPHCSNRRSTSQTRWLC